jgi:transposase-like protein
MEFIVTFLEDNTLRKCSEKGGLDYKKTSVEWVNYIRDLFRSYVHESLYGDEEKQICFRGIVEIDESLFGRSVKYNRGNGSFGLRVWVFGMVEVSTKRILLFPVEKRDAQTLIGIIQTYVERGSTIYSDAWLAYQGLNDLGYQHFTVEHKYQFKNFFRNTQTGQIVECCTNHVESSWRLSKLHFVRISGCQQTTFEGHLAEIVWRNHMKVKGGSLFQHFFELMTSFFPLTTPNTMAFTEPVWSIWSAFHLYDAVNVNGEDRNLYCIFDDEEACIPF